MKNFKEYLPYIAILLFVIFIKAYVITPIEVNGDSMYPTLNNRDIMILNKVQTELGEVKRFDIVVVKYDGKYLIKRVIGLPGETIEFKDNKLYIDGVETEENFLKEDVKTDNFKLEGKIPDNYYFVVGDNRPVSLDSRYLGAFSRSKIIGKTALTVFPFNRVGYKD